MISRIEAVNEAASVFGALGNPLAYSALHVKATVTQEA